MASVQREGEGEGADLPLERKRNLGPAGFMAVYATARASVRQISRKTPEPPRCRFSGVFPAFGGNLEIQGGQIVLGPHCVANKTRPRNSIISMESRILIFRKFVHFYQSNQRSPPRCRFWGVFPAFGNNLEIQGGQLVLRPHCIARKTRPKSSINNLNGVKNFNILKVCPFLSGLVLMFSWKIFVFTFSP